MSFWREGKSWIVASDPERQPYCTLVGGQDWSFELDVAETRQLATLLAALHAQWQASLAELMEAENLVLQAGGERLELTMEGDLTGFSLRVRLLSGRGAEGRWPQAESAEVVAALADLPG